MSSYLLIIALTITTTFNANAQWKAEITPNKAGVAGHSLGLNKNKRFNTEKKLNKRLKRLIKNSSWMKGDWDKIEAGSIVSKIKTERDTIDTGATEIITDLDGNETEVPVFEVVEVEVTYYYHPSNFTYIIRDDTDKELADKAVKEQEVVDRAIVKGMRKGLKKRQNESVAAWRSRIAGVLDQVLLDLYGKD